jgi:hypothetical protein
MEMDITAAELGFLVDREKIRECLARLARGEDRRDAALITASYWPDSTTDYGVFKGSFAEYLAWVVPGADAITNTQHVLGQSFIDLNGESARVETQVISYHRVDMGDGERDTCIGGRYLDVMEKRGGVWRIASRLMLYDWFQDWGTAIDWSQGVMGLQFSAPHFAGRAVGDYSKVFFGAAR